MKLKAVLKRGCPPELAQALESDEFDERVVMEVLVKYLHMSPNIGPAEFYIQECDYAGGRRGDLCEVRLTGVSVNRKRSVDNFYQARRALERVYAETIHPFLKPGQRLQLMVSEMLDRPPDKEETSLIERTGKQPAVWITGGAPLPEIIDQI